MQIFDLIRQKSFNVKDNDSDQKYTILSKKVMSTMPMININKIKEKYNCAKAKQKKSKYNNSSENDFFC